MLKAAFSAVGSAHGKAASMAGKIGGPTKQGKRIAQEGGKPADRMGARRVNTALGVSAATYTTRSARRSSARDGIQPRSMGGTTF